MSRVLVLGGTSSIARALGRELAEADHDVTLAGRDLPELDRVASDLAIRYEVKADTLAFEAAQPQVHRSALQAFLDDLDEPLGGAVWCIGYLGDQTRARHDWDEAQRVLDVNLTAALSSMGVLADALEEQGEGFLCAISSPAGERGRSSNYTYGAAKAGLTAYLQGLRQRLAKSGVQVTTIVPGFVDTRMTFGRDDMFLVASPERVAGSMVQAIEDGRDVVYVPWFWRPVLFGLRNVPSPLFKRLPL